VKSDLVARLAVIESLAFVPRVASTNLIARRIVSECIENELSLPQAMIIAGEQFAGRGRNQRQWSSPAGKGIYATTMITRPTSQLALVPLAMANIVARFLRDIFGLDARIKWPNDVFVVAPGDALNGAKKIAGILIEARIQDDRAFLLIGTGINVEPVADAPNAIAISEASPRSFTGIDDATIAFIEHIDAALAQPFERDEVIEEWRRLTLHRNGDRITCVIGDRTVDGTWNGIDEQGRALLRNGAETIAVSAGDIII